MQITPRKRQPFIVISEQIGNSGKKQQEMTGLRHQTRQQEPAHVEAVTADSSRLTCHLSESAWSRPLSSLITRARAWSGVTRPPTSNPKRATCSSVACINTSHCILTFHHISLNSQSDAEMHCVCGMMVMSCGKLEKQQLTHADTCVCLYHGLLHLAKMHQQLLLLHSTCRVQPYMTHTSDK